MARHRLSGRPNQAKPTDLDAARRISDVASRPFTSMAKGTAMERAPPAGAGHSYNPRDPYEYAKIKGQGATRPKVTP